MIIGYARVSTQDQNLDLQVNALNKAECEVIYQEKTSSVKYRPELRKMLSNMQENDTIIVYKLDRLGRSLVDLVNILNEIATKNAEFISLVDNFDTTTTQGKMLLGITMVFAEFERNLISDRVKAGLIAARKRGKKLGRKPYLSRESKDISRKVKTMRNKEHLTANYIQKTLNITKSQYYRALNR